MDIPRSVNRDSPRITIDRDVYTQEAFDQAYSVGRKPLPLMSRLRMRMMKCSVHQFLISLISFLPIIRFTRKYNIRENIIGDILAGLTVSFMHLPQAMGFGYLASLRPVHGLYTTFFPVLIYLIFGTSPFISFGTNAVMALLTKSVVDREAEAFIQSHSNGNESLASYPTEDDVMAVKIGAAMACSLIAGVFLMVLGIFRLGFITTYMSVSFVGGFTTAAAVHIASSQVPIMFGIKTNSYSGAGKLILMYVDLFRKIGQTKVPDMIICIICIVILLLVKICINERFEKKMKMPVPIDLLLVAVATMISYFANFQDNLGVKIVGDIPKGFVKPTTPILKNVGNFFSDAIVMGILSLAMTISMAKLTAKKHEIEIDDNQELFAYGTSNFISSFFSCFPSATAPPRTMILSSLGAKTTLNGIPTAIFILLVILLIGPLFSSLPLSVLAAMIIVSMKELLMQYRNLRRIWKINKYDFIIWIVTNFVSVFADLNYGVLAGIFVSLFSVVVQTQLSTGNLIGMAKDENLLLDIDNCRKFKNFPKIRVFKIPTSLYFATAEGFKSQIYSLVLNPRRQKEKMMKYSKTHQPNEKKAEEDKAVIVKGTTESSILMDEDIDGVILDCSRMTYLDIAGVDVLQQIVKEYANIDVQVFITGLADNPKSVLTASGFFDNFEQDRVFLDVFDAITVLRSSIDGGPSVA